MEGLAFARPIEDITLIGEIDILTQCRFEFFKINFALVENFRHQGFQYLYPFLVR